MFCFTLTNGGARPPEGRPVDTGRWSRLQSLAWGGSFVTWRSLSLPGSEDSSQFTSGAHKYFLLPVLPPPFKPWATITQTQQDFEKANIENKSGPGDYLMASFLTSFDLFGGYSESGGQRRTGVVFRGKKKVFGSTGMWIPCKKNGHWGNHSELVASFPFSNALPAHFSGDDVVIRSRGRGNGMCLESNGRVRPWVHHDTVGSVRSYASHSTSLSFNYYMI